jgi:myo-inositol-1(or 4)-monophosphatase
MSKQKDCLQHGGLLYMCIMDNYRIQLETAVEAAHLAGSYQRYRFASPVQIDLKGDKNLVTEVDRESERLIVTHLLTSFPTYNIVAEEGEYPQGDSQFRWVIDPLDGTTNYAMAFPGSASQ